MSSVVLTEQSLLFELRSPTTPTETKQASISLALSQSSALASLARDWMLDTLLRAQKTPSSSQASLFLSASWWSLLARAVSDAPAGSASSTPQTLAIIAHFVSAYAAQPEADAELVKSVTAVWSKLATTGLRKATVDGALDGYSALLKATAQVVHRQGGDSQEWEELVLVWLKTMRQIVDPVKAGKKIPTHTLAQLPTILTLLSALPPSSDSPLTASILETVQYALFNLDNLRRALARESYNAGTSASAAAATKDDTEGAAGELLQSLRTLMAEDESLIPHILLALPQLFALYHTALESHAPTLFPLPSRTSFPTPSAARSALEIHSLQKRRSLASSWVRGVSSLVSWADPSVTGCATSMAETVAEVERVDLYREGKENGWQGILDQVVAGAVVRLGKNKQERDALMALLGSTLRMSFTVIEPALPAVLVTLAASAPDLEGAQSSAVFLESLLDFHAKSLLLPSLIQLLSTALASPTAVENNLLTTHSFTASFRTKLATLVGSTVPSTWTSLVSAVEADLGLGSNATAAEADEASPSKKRRKMAATENVQTAAAAARLRLLALFAGALPLPLPLELFASFDTEHIQPALKELAKGKGKGKEQDRVQREMLGVRYAIVERLRRAGEEEAEWRLPEKRVAGLVELVRSAEEGATTVEVARTLLQSLSPATSQEAAQPILDAVLSRVELSEAAWSGHLRGMESAELSTALWELIARRWLVTFDLLADATLLARLAKIIADSIITAISPEITFASVTARLLRRADFWELTKLQAHLRTALLDKVSLPSVSPPTAMLEALSESKPAKALRSLTPEAVSAVVSGFAAYTALLPIEYAGRALCGQLIEQAVSLDVWLTGGKVELSDEERAKRQQTLRRFILLALGNRTATLNDAPAVLAHLVKNTASSDSALVSVTIELYAHFVRSVATNHTQVQPYLDAFDKPLAPLAKRFKKTVTSLTCEELAFFSLAEALASNLPARALLTPALLASLEELAQGAAKPFGRALGYATEALASDSAVALELGDTLRATQAFWQLKDYLSTDSADHDQLDLFSAFAQTALGALLTRSALTTDVRELEVRQAMLDLLTFRVARLRALSDKSKIDTLPFETLVACHLAFRQALGAQGASALESSLRRASSSSTLREYEAALSAVGGTIAAAVESDTAVLSITLATIGPALQVASILLRDGPEGSSRLSSASLTDVLRHLSFFLLRHAPGSAVPGAECTGEQVAQAFLLVAQFVEAVASDRPMLFSRQNVGLALSFVSRIAQPTPSSAYAEGATATEAATASALFLSLTAIVSQLVRHHKEHITQLFPQLVHATSALLVILRRAGYGTTGSVTASTEDEAGVVTEVITVANLGRKAEREARETFPFWAWEGGASAFTRDEEGKAVARLLSSLTTKTASVSHGTKRSAPGATNAKEQALLSLAAPLSKHAPFLLLAYLRACVHPLAPIPSAIRNELQGGWFEVMDVLGKWEREALMKGFLGENEGAERGVLRGMWRAWETGRYKG